MASVGQCAFPDFGPLAEEMDELSRVLQDAWAHQFDPDDVNQALLKFTPFLVDPLKQKVPDDASANNLRTTRNHFQLSGIDRPINFSESSVEWILKFASSTHLNANTIVLLMNRVGIHVGGRANPDLIEHVTSLYFSSRNKRLQSLQELLTLYIHINLYHDTGTVWEGIQQGIFDSIETLVNNDLATHLMESVRSLATGYDTLFRNEIQQEIRSVCRILYVIISNIQITENELKLLCDTLFTVISHPEFDSPHPDDYSSATLKTSAYYLVLCLFLALDTNDRPTLLDPRDNHQLIVNKLQRIDVKSILTTLLTQSWPTGHDIQAIVELIEILFEKKLSHAVPAALAGGRDRVGEILDRGAFRGLRAFLKNPVFVSEDSDTFTNMLYIVALLMSDTFDYCLEEVKTYTERQGLRRRGHGDENNGCLVILEIFQLLAKRCSTSIQSFLESKNVLAYFEFVDQRATPGTLWFEPYANLVYRLACVQPKEMFEFVQLKSTQLRIESVLSILNTTLKIYSVQDHRMHGQGFGPYNEPPERPTLLKEEERVLICFLKVLQAFVPLDEMQMAYPRERWVDIIFNLMPCYFPINLRAHLFHTMTRLVEGNPQLADHVWHRIEEMQILTTVQTHVHVVAGIEKDLEDSEKHGVEAEYPITIAFCQLILKLLQTTDIPQSLGHGNRFGGIQPYIEYIRERVFKRWDLREYGKENERWELAATCLQVFDKLLSLNPTQFIAQHHIPSVFVQFPAFEMMTMLTVSHEKLIDVILAVFQRSYEQKCDQQIQQTDYTDAVELCLHSVLQLLAHAMDWEKRFLEECQKHWPNKLSVRALSTTLLSSQYRSQIGGFAACIDYNDRSDIQIYAIKILLALNKENDGLTLRGCFQSRSSMNTIQSSFANQLRRPHRSEYGETVDDVRALLVQFILECVSMSDQNLGLALLGFSDQGAIQDDFTSEFSCLRHVMNLVLKPRLSVVSPGVAESCYELLYRLLSSQRVNRRFMNAAKKHSAGSPFFTTLLQFCVTSMPIQPNVTILPTEIRAVERHLRQRSWILRALALQIHLGQKNPDWKDSDGDPMQFLGFLDSARGMNDDEPVVRLLDDLGIDARGGSEVMEMSFWNVNVSDFRVIDTNSGEYKWDINSLENKLRENEMSRGIVMSDTQKAEKHAFLDRLTEWNQYVDLKFALNMAYESWAQLVECALLVCASTSSDVNNGMFLSLLCEILNQFQNEKATRDNLFSHAAVYASKVALNIMQYFRNSLAVRQIKFENSDSQGVLQSIVQAITHQPDSRTNTRGNLYATLLNCLHYCSNVQFENFVEPDSMNEGKQFELDKRNAKTLMDAQQPLFDTIFSDSTGSDPYLSSMACLVYESLLRSYNDIKMEEYGDAMPSLMYLQPLFVRSRLSFFLKKVDELDSSVRQALSAQRNAHFVYQFECMMQVLVTVATFKEGSAEMVECGSVRAIMNLESLSSRVVWGSHRDSDQLTPQIQRYLQVLIPCLRLLNTMFQSNPLHRRLHYQTLQLLNLHGETFSRILSLASADTLVLRCTKLILSLYCHLYGGPLYARDPTHLSPQDQELVTQIENKERLFFELFVRIVRRLTPSADDRDVDIEMIDSTGLYHERGVAQNPGELPDKLNREILRILLAMFRFRSFGSSPKALARHMDSKGDHFRVSFTRQVVAAGYEFDVADGPPLFCIGQAIIAVRQYLSELAEKLVDFEKECGEIRRTLDQQTNTSALMNATEIVRDQCSRQLEIIRHNLRVIEGDMRLHFHLLEQLVVTMYFHTLYYMQMEFKNHQTQFANQFRAQIEPILKQLTEWLRSSRCIWNVEQSNIEHFFQSLKLSNQTRPVLEKFLELFQRDQRDYDPSGARRSVLQSLPLTHTAQNLNISGASIGGSASPAPHRTSLGGRLQTPVRPKSPVSHLFREMGQGRSRDEEKADELYPR